MPRNLASRFQLFEFDEHEKFILTDTQVAYIRHLIAVEAEKRLNLELDTANVSGFVQSEAYFKGKIEFGQQLLDLHEETLAALREQEQISGENK